MKAGEYFEGCGKPRHKRESCQLAGHPNSNQKGLWIHSEGFKLKKAYLEANGKGDEHPEVRVRRGRDNKWGTVPGRQDRSGCDIVRTIDIL